MNRIWLGLLAIIVVIAVLLITRHYRGWMTSMGFGPNKWHYDAIFANGLRLQGLGTDNGVVYDTAKMSTAIRSDARPVVLTLGNMSIVLGESVNPTVVRTYGVYRPNLENDINEWDVLSPNESLKVVFDKSWIVRSAIMTRSVRWNTFDVPSIHASFAGRDLPLPISERDLENLGYGKPKVTSRFVLGP